MLKKTAPTVNIYFDAKLSRTSVYWKNTPIHQSIVGRLSYQLRRRLSSPAHFDFAVNTAISSNLPIPDLHAAYTDREAGVIYRPIFAVEVGFSELRESLENCVKDLLTKMPHVKAAVMVDIKETPNYKNPLRKPTSSKIGHGLLQQDPRYLLEEDACLEDSSDKDSPLFRFGLHWVGRMRGSAQVWTRDAESQKPIPGEQVVSPYRKKTKLKLKRNVLLIHTYCNGSRYSLVPTPRKTPDFG